MRRALLGGMLLACALLLWPAAAAAQEPNYALPQGMTLPWACGEGHTITWGPTGHWADAKAAGLAFDFAMPEGTPLYAPFAGQAYFMLDERPFETNFGNYIEIVDESGDWLVRLAHLRDEQVGERRVKAGEPLGYSGASGVTVAHLHLELLVRDGAQWVAPDVARLEGFFGLLLSDYVEGALITHDGCVPTVRLSGPVAPVWDGVALGSEAELTVSLRNEGLEALTLRQVQALLFSPTGASLVASASGEWQLAPVSDLTVTVRAQMPVVGDWYVGRVTYRADERSGGMPAKGQVRVLPPPLELTELTLTNPVLITGQQLGVRARVHNAGGEPLTFDDLVVEGSRPDGATWQAWVGQELVLAPDEALTVEFVESVVPEAVGIWRVERLGYRREGQVDFFADVSDAFYVFGADLRAQEVRTYLDDEALHVFVTLCNVGTHTAYPSAVEVWGWAHDGETVASARDDRVAPIAPGASALIRLDVPLGAPGSVWKLVEIGAWQEGRHYRIALPEKAASPAGARN